MPTHTNKVAVRSNLVHFIFLDGMDDSLSMSIDGMGIFCDCLQELCFAFDVEVVVAGRKETGMSASEFQRMIF